MTEKQLSPKQINILVKNGITDPWNMPYQEAADKIGEIIAGYEKPEVVKPGEVAPGGVIPKNGKEYHLSIEECRARALECALTISNNEYPSMEVMKNFFNWIWKGE